MPKAFLSFVSIVSFVVISAPAGARAQDYEGVGIRAKGMAGAFVAVADDATASWWNPAGLASGAYLNSIIEFGHLDQGDQSKAIAVAFPALGLSYYRLIISELQPVASIGANTDSRQDQGPLGVGVRRLEVSQFGTTVGQSIGEHLVVASTLKLVR